VVRLSLPLSVGIVFTLIVPARAVESYNTISQTAGPASTDGTGISGAAYVGQIESSAASAVYLGNGFVLTAAHVPVGTFTLNHVDYTVVPNSAEAVSSGADLTLFQIYTTSSLPSTSLTLATSDPMVGSTVQLVGYGVITGVQTENFAVDTITSVYTGTQTEVNGYESDDFQTLDYPGASGNYGQLIGGDSGGGDFSTSSGLTLVGLNEAELVDNGTGNPVGSDYIQISEYSTQITDLMAAAVPEPPGWLLLALGLGAAGIVSRGMRQGQGRAFPFQR
jgi:hypothetical protein